MSERGEILREVMKVRALCTADFTDFTEFISAFDSRTTL
jgi:hypothetical protein